MSDAPAPNPAPKKQPTPRKTLALYGRRGDQVRVAEDKTADAVVVYYRDVAGLPHKRTFTRTPEGRAEAKAWAAAYLPARAAEAKRRAEPQPQAKPRTTHAELWAAYSSSPDFAGLREKTRENYGPRWRSWEHFRGSDTPVDDTTLHHVDQLRTELKAAKRATNQVRQILGVARIVMAWGQSRKLVTTNELALFKWKTPKGEEALEPAEYTEVEYLKILAQLPAQDGGRWRPHVAWMLAGHHGQRIESIRLLTVDDARAALETGVLVWRADIMKQGKEHRQPLTPEGRAAFRTALDWRQRLGYPGPWLLFAGGGNKRLGAATTRPAGRAHRGSPRRERPPEQDVPVTYQGLWLALTKAEDRAGVDHLERRAFHGGRKMNGGLIWDATGDAELAMAWIGDTSPAMRKKYLKRSDERLARAAEHVRTTGGGTVAKRAPRVQDAAPRPVPLNRLSKAQRAAATGDPRPPTKPSPNRPARTVPPETASAPAGTGALTADHSITSESPND